MTKDDSRIGTKVEDSDAIQIEMASGRQFALSDGRITEEILRGDPRWREHS